MGLLHEQRFPLNAKSKLGVTQCTRTLKNWHYKGRVCKKNKKLVYLEAIFEGRPLVTSREAIRRFLCALNGIPLEQANAIQG